LRITDHHYFVLTPGFNRAQILYYIAENLELRKSEFAERISSLTGKSVEISASEVDKSIYRLFYWAAFADKYGGAVQVKVPNFIAKFWEKIIYLK